jgi:ATP-dependent DNA helicase RecG
MKAAKPVFSGGDVFKTYIPAPVGIEGTVEGTIEGAIEGATKPLKQKLKELLIVIAKNEGFKSVDYIERTEIPKKSIERYLKILREAGMIEFIGDATQTGGYFLTQSFKSKLGN